MAFIRITGELTTIRGRIGRILTAADSASILLIHSF